MSKNLKAGKTPMTREAAARIQSATAKTHDGSVPKGSFATTAQSASAKNVPRPPNRPTKKARPA
jgi:hypothetical protein